MTKPSMLIRARGGRNNGNSTKTQQNDDARGRAPPHRNNNRSQGRDDRKGMMQDVSGLGGGEHPDRRGRNDGGRNSANRRTRGHNRN